MASIGKEAGGTRRILFCAPDGKRKTIRLGKVTQRQAEAVCVRVEALVAAQFTNAAPDPETSRWLGDIEPALHDKLAAVGLVAARECGMLGPFLREYIALRTDVRDRTTINYDQAAKNLIKFFGDNKPLSEITQADAEGWRIWLLKRLADSHFDLSSLAFAAARIARRSPNTRYTPPCERSVLMASHTTSRHKSQTRNSRILTHFLTANASGTFAGTEPLESSTITAERPYPGSHQCQPLCRCQRHFPIAHPAGKRSLTRHRFLLPSRHRQSFLSTPPC